MNNTIRNLILAMLIMILFLTIINGKRIDKLEQKIVNLKKL
jgi:hypothetical protein